VGIHPWYTSSSDEKGFERLEQLLSAENCLAVGECGIDVLKGGPVSRQWQIFERQLHLAVRFQKPVIIHSVRAMQEILDLRRRFFPDHPFLFHGFNSRFPHRFIPDDNVYYSFGKALITSGPNALRLIKNLDISQILLETDASEISIEEIYEAACIHTGLSMDSLKIQLFENYKRLFKPLH
jgi:TatD DNase family protein